MTLYWTDKTTGEMVPILEPLRHKPRGKVRRLPSTRITNTYSRSYRRASRRVSPEPIADAIQSLAMVLIALAILLALFIPSLT